MCVTETAQSSLHTGCRQHVTEDCSPSGGLRAQFHVDDGLRTAQKYCTVHVARTRVVKERSCTQMLIFVTKQPRKGRTAGNNVVDAQAPISGEKKKKKKKKKAGRLIWRHATSVATFWYSSPHRGTAASQSWPVTTVRFGGGNTSGQP